MWSAAIKDHKGFSKAAGQFQSYLSPLKRTPYFTKDIRNNNEIMQHVIHGEAILRLNGIDMFTKKKGKYSLDDAVGFHANAVLQNGNKRLKTGGDPHDRARSIMRADGHRTHLAWIPVYLSFSNSEAGRGATLALSKELRRINRDPYWGMAMGVHTGCLFGR